MLNISALILDWLQVKKESQSNFNKSWDSPKLETCQTFLLSDLFASGLFWSVWWRQTLLLDRQIVTSSADRICMDWIGKASPQSQLWFLQHSVWDLHPGLSTPSKHKIELIVLCFVHVCVCFNICLSNIFVDIHVASQCHARVINILTQEQDTSSVSF